MILYQSSIHYYHGPSTTFSGVVSICFGGSSPLPWLGARSYGPWGICIAASGTSCAGGLSAANGLKFHTAWKEAKTSEFNGSMSSKTMNVKQDIL